MQGTITKIEEKLAKLRVMLLKHVKGYNLVCAFLRFSTNHCM